MTIIPQVRLDDNFHIKRGGAEPAPSARYNQYRWEWYNNPKRYYVSLYPIHLDIELNSHCVPGKCPTCFQTMDKIPKQFMPIQMVKKLIREGKPRAIKLQYRGEPLLYNKMGDVIHFAKTHGVLEVMFNTNGCLLNDHTSQILIKRGLDKIIFSIDSYLKENHERCRPGIDFDQVVRNVISLQALKQLYGRKYPIVRVQKIDFEHLRGETCDYIDFFADIADHVAVIEFLDYSPHENNEPFPQWCCAQLWQRMVILADGKILPCTGVNSKFNVVGDAFTDNIADVWHSPKMEDLRNYHMTGQSHEIEMCRRCPMRDFYYKKEVLKQ